VKKRKNLKRKKSGKKRKRKKRSGRTKSSITACFYSPFFDFPFFGGWMLFLTEIEENDLPWCLRGYPFKCTYEEAIQFIDVEDVNLLYALDKVCRNCPKRLEYEKHHIDFTI